MTPPRGPRLHADATATTLAVARLLVCGVWVVRLALTRFAELGQLSPELFHPHGVMLAIPDGVTAALTTPSGFLALQAIAIGAFLIAAAGPRGGRVALVVGAATVTLLFGLAKGFGGHVNHRELVLLYLTFALLVLPCFDALALNARRVARERATYAASMQFLCSLILLNYFFVGAARLFVGAPAVFDPALMYDWVASRNLRPNPWDFGVGWALLQSGVGRLALGTALPVSTLIELAAPLALWKGGRVAMAVAALLASFHIGIFLIMNIPFLENVAVLILLLPYTRWVDRGLASDQAVLPVR